MGSCLVEFGLLRGADTYIFVARGAGEHMAQADAAFGYSRQIGVTHVAKDRLFRVFDFNEEVACLFDNSDRMWHARFEETLGIVIRFKVGSLQSGGVWYIAAGANIRLAIIPFIWEGGIADVVGMHMVEIHPHGGLAAQFVPFANVLHIRLLAAAGGLNVEDVDAARFIVEACKFVFNFNVACEVLLCPQHHVVRIVFKLRASCQHHTVRASGDGAHLAIEEPLLGPVAGAGVTKNALPVIVVCLFKGSLVWGEGSLHSSCSASGQ